MQETLAHSCRNVRMKSKRIPDTGKINLFNFIELSVVERYQSSTLNTDLIHVYISAVKPRYRLCTTVAN